MSDTKWGLSYVPTPVVYENWEYTNKPCTHIWVATGTRRTWCKDCDCDGLLDPVSGVVTVVFREKMPVSSNKDK